MHGNCGGRRGCGCWNVQAQSIPPEGVRLRYLNRHAHSAPKADVDRHRQRVCPREPSTRHLFARQQTAVINSIRAHLAEFCMAAPVGRRGVDQPLDKRESRDL